MKRQIFFECVDSAKRLLQFIYSEKAKKLKQSSKKFEDLWSSWNIQTSHSCGKTLLDTYNWEVHSMNEQNFQLARLKKMNWFLFSQKKCTDPKTNCEQNLAFDFKELETLYSKKASIAAKDWRQLPVKNLQKGIQLYENWVCTLCT